MSTMNLSAVTWRKSTHSGTTGEECVEVAGLPALVAVRDSKHPDGAVLGFSQAAFGALVRAL